MSAPASSSSSFFDLVRSGDPDRLESLLTQESNIDINQIDELGMNGLMIACQEGKEEMVRALLAHGSRLDTIDSNGDSPLIFAADGGNDGCIELLFHHAASSSSTDVDFDINLSNHHGDTALMKACRSLESSTVEKLLNYEEQRLNIDLQNEEGENALLITIRTGSKEALEIVKLLLDYGSSVSISKVNRSNKLTGETPLLVAMVSQHWEMIQLLSTTKGIEIDKTDYEGNTPLMHCVMDELPISYAKHLLEVCHANQLVQNKKGYTALHLAIRDSNQPLIELLISTAPSGIAELLDSEFGWTPLQHVCSKNMKDVLKVWGEKGLNVMCKDRRGSTAAHLSARFGYLTCLKYIIKFGGGGVKSLNVTDLSGNTPLHDAASGGHGEIIQYMREKGANITQRDGRGNNILHKLIQKEPSNLMAILETLFTSLNMDELTKLLHTLNADGETVWMQASRKVELKNVCQLFEQYCQNGKVRPFPPKMTTVRSDGDHTIVVQFKTHENDRFMMLGYKYEVIATPMVGEKEEPIVEEKKKVLKKKITTTINNDASPSAVISTPIKKTSSASNKKSSSTKKPPSSASSSISTSSSSASSTTTSIKKVRPIVTAGPTPQSVIGSISPLRISNLINGVRYSLSMVTHGPGGITSQSSLESDSDITSQPTFEVLVGTPSPPSITGIIQGTTWINVNFMPNVTTIGTGTTNVDEKSAITEFELIATLHSSTTSVDRRATSTSSSSVGDVGVNIVRSVTCISSPVLVTPLQPGLTYDIRIRSKNGFGAGAWSTTRVVGENVTTPSRPQTASSYTASSASALQSGGQLIPLTPSIDSSELREASTMLTNLCAKGIHFDISPTTPTTGAMISRIENLHLKTAFENGRNFLQGLGCQRSEAEREELGVLMVETKEIATNIAKYGVLPFQHPMSHGFIQNGGSVNESNYNQNQFPAGNPFRYVSLATSITRKMLLASNAGGGGDGGSNTTLKLLICRILPGRSQLIAPGASSPPSPSIRFDSTRSGTYISLNSSNQVLPVYLVECAIPASLTASMATTTSDDASISPIDAALEADARAQVLDDDAIRPSAAPIRTSQQVALNRRIKSLLGAPPPSSFEPPGELPSGEKAAKDMIGSASAAASSSAGAGLTAGARRPTYDDGDDDGEGEERLDINKASSALLGPAGGPTKKANSGSTKKR